MFPSAKLFSQARALEEPRLLTTLCRHGAWLLIADLSSELSWIQLVFAVVWFAGVPLGKAAHRNPGSTTGGRVEQKAALTCRFPSRLAASGQRWHRRRRFPTRTCMKLPVMLKLDCCSSVHIKRRDGQRRRALASRRPQDLLREATSLCEELASVGLCNGCA